MQRDVEMEVETVDRWAPDAKKLWQLAYASAVHWCVTPRL